MDWTIFWTIFWTISSQGGAGGRVLLLREGCKRYWLMELLLDRTNYFNRFFD